MEKRPEMRREAVGIFQEGRMPAAEQRHLSVRKAQRCTPGAFPRYEAIGLCPSQPHGNGELSWQSALIGFPFREAAPGLRKKRRKRAPRGDDALALRTRRRTRQDEAPVIGRERRVEPGRAARAGLEEGDHPLDGESRNGVDGRKSAGIAENQGPEFTWRPVRRLKRSSAPDRIANENRPIEPQRITQPKHDFRIARGARRAVFGRRTSLAGPIQRDDLEPVAHPPCELGEVAAAMTCRVQAQNGRTGAPTLDRDAGPGGLDMFHRLVCAERRQDFRNGE